MTDLEIQSISLTLEVAKNLLRETPEVYKKMESAAMDCIYTSAKERSLTMSHIARLLRKDTGETEDLIARARDRH